MSDERDEKELHLMILPGWNDFLHSVGVTRTKEIIASNYLGVSRCKKEEPLHKHSKQSKHSCCDIHAVNFVPFPPLSAFAV